MIVRTLYERRPFIVNGDGSTTDVPGRRAWWSVSTLCPSWGGWGLWPLPALQVERSGPETTVWAYWLAFGVCVWWQSSGVRARRV